MHSSIPSVLLPLELFAQRLEFNVMLNPGHPDFRTVRVTRNYPYTFDPRMWKDR
ncbi:MAG: hypothetical protein HYY36_03780 [Gammaproteobacteria bacterium]|nr:hypothetical protein [Gammaproteobacteria bacterium]